MKAITKNEYSAQKKYATLQTNKIIRIYCYSNHLHTWSITSSACKNILKKFLLCLSLETCVDSIRYIYDKELVSYILFFYLYSYASFLDISSTFKAWNILLSRNLNIEHISSKRQSNQRNLSAYLTFTSSSQYWIRDNKLHRFEKNSFIMRNL